MNSNTKNAIPAQSVIVVPAEEWQRLKKDTADILRQLKSFKPPPKDNKPVSPYITAKEFMAAVRICRSSFDKLVNQNKIMTLKKGRKVYVVATEVERYFREVEL